MPFGIKSAPEHYQKIMTQILKGLHGHISIIDGMLIHGKTQKEHDEKGRAVLKKPPSYQPVHHHLAFNAVLLQEQDNKENKPVAYASRSMTSKEQRYVQIEKEALETTWASEKFNDYILGKDN